MDISAKQVGANIKEVRRQHNLSQTELARLLEMRPGPVSCIENGKNFPSVKVLQRLATILNVPIDRFFSSPDLNAGLVVNENPVLYSTIRSEATVPYIVTPQLPVIGPHAVLIRNGDELRAIDIGVIEFLSDLTNAVLALEDICKVQKYTELPLYIPFDFTIDGVKSLAHHVRRFIGVNDAIVYDYIELLENSGLRIIFCAFPEKIESISCYDEDNSNAFIIIQASMNVERQLFRLLYELGRIYRYTHKKYGDSMSNNKVSYIRNKKIMTDHRAARLFAALFIQPAEAVCSSVRQLGVEPDQWTWELLLRLKHRFGVSAETFIYRLTELGLMTPDLENKFRDEIHKHYNKTNFSEPNSSRRTLNLNGRVGDLLLLAKELHHTEEVDSIEKTLKRYGCII